MYTKRVPMKKILLIYFLIFGYQITNADPNDNVSLISAGFKMGYVFGEHGGFVWGIEISYVNWVVPFVGVGPTLNVDYFNKTLKLHLNAEAVTLAGISVGPTLILKDKNWAMGYNFSFFAGLQHYLFYNFTNMGKVKYDEFGVFFKQPILITGRISAG